MWGDRFEMAVLGCRSLVLVIIIQGNKMEKWAYFTIHQKSWNSGPFLLILCGASKQHKRLTQKVFHHNIKALGCFKGMVCVHSIRGFPEFPFNPYYEPLVWFIMVRFAISCFKLKLQCKFFVSARTYTDWCNFWSTSGPIAMHKSYESNNISCKNTLV